MTGGTGLRGLLANATPGPWAVYAPWDRVPCVKAADEFVADECGIENARLIALAPDMARLLVDTFAWVDEILTKPYRVEERWNAGNALLARFAELEERAR